MFIKKTFLPIFLTTIWISLSEFVRNELLLKSFWIEHYKNMGISFPSAPMNNAVWGVWSLLFAIAVFVIVKKFSLIQSFIFSWFIAFVLMWVVIGNLGVLPFKILFAAIPLSLFETILACFITIKLSKEKACCCK